MGSGYKLWGWELGFSFSFLIPRRSQSTPGPGIIGNMENLEFGNLAPGDSRTKSGHEWGQNWSDFDDLGFIRRQILWSSPRNRFWANLGPQKFWIFFEGGGAKIIFFLGGAKFFLPTQKILGPKKIWVQNIFFQKNLGPDTFQTPSGHHPDTIQTPSRHHPDTLQTPFRHPPGTSCAWQNKLACQISTSYVV